MTSQTDTPAETPETDGSDGQTAGAPGGSGRRSGPAMRSWRSLFRDILALAGPYWRSRDRWKAIGWTVALVILTIGQVSVPVALNVWSERLFDALEQRAFPMFMTLIGALLVIIGGNVMIVAVHLRTKRRLQVAWRGWLSRRLLDEWMAAGRHYQATLIEGEHDNPDGRIAEDIRIATEYAVDLAHSLLYAVLILISFTQILWTLSGSPEITLFGVDLYLPGHLVWVALIYATIGTSVAFFLGRPLVRAVNRRQTDEANFRFGLVHARENSLAIAVLHGEPDERRRLNLLFRGVSRAWDRQTGALTNIFFFTASWSVLSQVFPVLIAAPRYISGAITLGGLMQTAQAFQQMIAALSWPIDNLSKVAEWRASVERVLGLHDAMLALSRRNMVSEGPTIALRRTSDPVFGFSRLQVLEPDGTLVIAPFDGQISAGQKMLITGDPAMVNKLFKVVARLWPWGSGRLDLPQREDLFFMPQRPYLPIGDLRAVVCYPMPPEHYGDEQIVAVLKRVGLEDLIPSLEAEATWENVLPVGDQQRLGFARLLLTQPRWICLQDATDGLIPEDEHAMLRILQRDFASAGILIMGRPVPFDGGFDRILTISRVNSHAEVAETPVVQTVPFGQ
ncbi:ABC transporter ATP-binding protein/permease [Novispirillum itersonii]|uniref:Putative ATP-binding cassette transporter n=1 Tax=Novispirillum itersonii TaxID=189 RepID=A0A7W9ZKG9_NOVIT|nr:ABC transporter ATP-binding protein/permease [Novispirillum itersonii]MBB6211869.1 putative ATP-binding cassette transporter [Novispirillum itersonii]